jgi:cytochrome c oxidase subunit 2
MWASYVFLADFPFVAPVASKEAGDIDLLWWFLCAVSLVMTVLIFVGVIGFALKYRAKPGVAPVQLHGNTALEVTWSIIPFLVMLVMFWWGTDLFFAAQSPPKDAMEIFVVGKQWMWKVQYPDGFREINALHVPVGQDVKLTLASEDVIHSFGIPVFRVRHDVVPGHYDSLWFRPTVPGHYRIYCTEYCGDRHSQMVGWVDVLGENEYSRWASGGGSGGTLAEQGQALFTQNGCSTCHLLNEQGRCPILKNLYNKPVQLNDGRTVIADDAYLRESILQPNAKIVNGFEANVMPNFQGQLSEENVIQLIAYIKSLTPAATASQVGVLPTNGPQVPAPGKKQSAATKGTALKPALTPAPQQ